MGMGLAKSYEFNNKIFCIYNTLEGQKVMEIKLDRLRCPKFLKNKKKEQN